MIETASANTREMIIAGKIFGDADGLRPNARIAANPITAITTDGPAMVMNITASRTKFSIIKPVNRYMVNSKWFIILDVLTI